MIDFIQSVYEAYGRVLLMDNASYRRSKKLMEEFEKYGGNIRIVYQPAYPPDLNPVEMVWKELKKYIANGLYKKVDGLTGAMDAMIQDGTVLLPSLPVCALDATRQGRAAVA